MIIKVDDKVQLKCACPCVNMISNIYFTTIWSPQLYPRKLCMWRRGGGILFSRPSVRQCLHPSVRGFRIWNNKEVSVKFQKHVLVIMTFAFVTSYCFKQKLCFELIFDSNKLRSHLLECFENNRISKFPLTNKTLSARRKKRKIKQSNFKIIVYAIYQSASTIWFNMINVKRGITNFV